MSETPFPASLGEMNAWAKRNSATAEQARRRFVQFAVLASVAASKALADRITFKGGNALRFVYGNRRSTLDLDFSAEDGFPDSAGVIRDLLDDALRSEERRTNLRGRCQSAHRNPKDLGKTRPTYLLKIGYQLPGDRDYQNVDARLAAGKPFPDVVKVEISLNDVVCEAGDRRLSPDTRPLRVCTLEDILAEKLRALLQQAVRNRSRPQDVFDVASMIRMPSATVDLAKVAAYLVIKAEARDIVARKAAFNDDVRSRAEADYDDQIKGSTTDFIPFDEAWAVVVDLMARLDLPP